MSDDLGAPPEPAPAALRTGAMAGWLARVLDDAPPRIGPYRIVGEIGGGGMGVVYRAEQEAPIRRAVALKVLKQGLSSREAAARFEWERQALALMNHPNIARVFDAGTLADGRPYLVMELVAGEPITSYCERRGLDLRRRLDLVVQICEGAQHAHHNGVIHRDLKPSNVLVAEIDGRPVPKIIDFGIAKHLDGRVTPGMPETRLSDLLGTPEYMSPEQAQRGAAAVDARTDVYSLGVLLYELLAGERPFATPDCSLEELLRRIRDDEPPLPSVRAAEPSRRRLRGELDWIALRALAKEPGRRYATPAELAADIRRHLGNEAVMAGPPGALYRARKLVRRHRAIAGLTLLLLASLMGFSLITVLQKARIAREAERANQKATEADAITEFLLGMFEKSSRIGGGGPRTHRDDRTARADRARAALADRPLLLARLLQAMGEDHLRAGLTREALPLLREARQGFAAERKPDDPLSIAAVESVGSAHLAAGRYSEAEPWLLEAVGRFEDRLGPAHADTLRARSRLGYLYKTWGRHQDAEEQLETAARGLAGSLGPDHPDTLTTEGYRVGVLLEQRRYAEAEVLARRLVERMPGALGDDELDLQIAKYNLACACANLGRRSEALRYLDQSIAAGFAYVGSIFQDPHLVPLHGDPEMARIERRARVNGNYARFVEEAGFLLREGRRAEAERLLRELLNAVRRIHGRSDHRSALVPMLLLADLHLRQGRFDEAERVLMARLEVVRRDPSVHPSNAAVTLWYLVQCHLGRGEKGRALERLDESLADGVYREHSDVWAYSRAMRAAIHDDTGEALRFLALAAERGYEDAAWLRRDLAFRALRGRPEFEATADAIAARARW